MNFLAIRQYIIGLLFLCLFMVNQTANAQIHSIKSNSDIELMIDKNDNSSLFGYFEIFNGKGKHLFWVNEAGNAKVTNNFTVGGFDLIHQGADFKLGTNDGRSIGTKKLQRALVHYFNGINKRQDALYLNFAGDFEGGVRVQGLGMAVDGAITIGTQNIPRGYKLAVKGKGIMEELKIQLAASWPDYVFENTYQLSPLAEVEAFIQTNGHLPGIPSAKNIEANDGVDIGEMQRLMMEKIEELTLYVIQLEKDQQVLKAQIAREK